MNTMIDQWVNSDLPEISVTAAQRLVAVRSAVMRVLRDVCFYSVVVRPSDHMYPHGVGAPKIER